MSFYVASTNFCPQFSIFPFKFFGELGKTMMFILLKKTKDYGIKRILTFINYCSLVFKRSTCTCRLCFSFTLNREQFLGFCNPSRHISACLICIWKWEVGRGERRGSFLSEELGELWKMRNKEIIEGNVISHSWMRWGQ